MIPRVRPSYGVAELLAALRPGADAVAAFEAELAAHFGTRHALVFPYGRSAIHACLRALDLTGEVVQPAYNCVVVAHATVLAGCRPVFVDSEADSPNQDPDETIGRVGPHTVAVLPTSTFGLTFDGIALCEAIRRRNSAALIVMDCCQCFDARWQGDSLVTQGDAAVLAFGIGKPMTTLFGGALVTNRDDLAAAVYRYREATFRARPPLARLRRWMYFLASWAAFTAPLAGFANLLENGATPLRRYLATLRAREAIGLPADNAVWPTPMEAAIGRVQLQRVTGFLDRRRAIAARYTDALADLDDLELLQWPAGSSYAIYAARLRQPAQRDAVLASLRAAGVQGDTTVGYVVPDLACYRARGYDGAQFPNAMKWASSVINFPNHPTMADTNVDAVIRAVRRAFGQA